MRDHPIVVAFDVDADSFATLSQAFPDGGIKQVTGATAASLIRNWDPEMAGLLVVGFREPLADAFALCRGLRSQAGRGLTPLVVLVPTADGSVVKAALDAGADACLVLPVHVKDFARFMVRAGRGNQPGRHTLNLHRAQSEDLWRDDGGEA